MDNLMDAYWRTPAVARTAATTAFVISLGIHTGLIPSSWFGYYWQAIWTLPPQLWRLVTTYLVTMPGLGILFDTYMLFTYLSALETNHPRIPRREDLLWYLTFVCGFILISSTFITGFPAAGLPALNMALCYSATQDQRGMTAQFYFVNIPSQLFPYAIMFVSYLTYGTGMVIIQLHGLFAAHLWDFLKRIWPEFGGGPNLIHTPSFMSRFVQTPRVLERSFGTAIRPTGSSERSTGTSTGASTGPLPDAWKTRGRGQRLG